MVHIHEILKDLNRRPLIVCTIGRDNNLLQAAKEAKDLGADILEIRIDQLNAKERDAIEVLICRIKDACALPILATVRSPNEQGPIPSTVKLSASSKLNDAERAELYEKIIPLVDLIDTEISSNAINAKLVKTAHLFRKKVILSSHDFASMPSENKVLRLIDKYKELGGDIFKCVGTPQTLQEVGSFLSICQSVHGMDRVFIAMGDIGKISRIAGFAFGSCLTYGYIGKKAAPGQIPLKELVPLAKNLYPSN